MWRSVEMVVSMLMTNPLEKNVVVPVQVYVVDIVDLVGSLQLSSVVNVLPSFVLLVVTLLSSNFLGSGPSGVRVGSHCLDLLVT